MLDPTPSEMTQAIPPAPLGTPGLHIACNPRKETLQAGHSELCLRPETVGARALQAVSSGNSSPYLCQERMMF